MNLRENAESAGADELAESLRDLIRSVPGLRAHLSRASEADLDSVVGSSPDPAALAARLGFEAQKVRLEYSEVRAFLSQTGPCLLRPTAGEECLVSIVRGGRRWCQVPGGRRSIEDILERLTGDLRGGAREEVESLVAALEPDRREKARRALIEQRISQVPAVEGWVLSLPPGSPFLAQLRHLGIGRRLIAVLACHGLGTALLIVSWSMIGRGALGGSLDRGWLWAWALLLLTTVPLAAMEKWSRGSMAWLVGAALKRRLLQGALRLDPDEVRGQGTGQILGRIIDSERLESLAMNGGLASLVGGLEIVLAAAVLSAGAAPALHLSLLLTWLLVLAGVSYAHFRRRLSWTFERLHLTHGLVERLLGHRTRLVQEPSAEWHRAEDHELAAYGDESKELDRWLPRLEVLIPRGFMIVALVALIPKSFAGHLDPVGLAISLGGILLASTALQILVGGVAELAGAGIAWIQVGPLFGAAAETAEPRPASGAPVAPEDGEPSPFLVGDDLAYRHEKRARNALDACSLEISAGDRILLEGPSGIGKSTLLSLLAGLRRPDRGWLGFHGLDMAIWGQDEWRRHIVYAPQFHENYLVSESLAFNLLMGRRWPATEEDLEEAKQICFELGLGPLLDAMPAGLMQPVGDSGWRLSHGERTRVFLGRALLQNAQLVILDETFAGLDLGNLEYALACVERRAPSLLIVAHP